MIKNSSNLLILVIVAILFGACKKETGSPYGSLFENTVWTGEFTPAYSLKAEPYSMECKTGGKFSWHEYSGDYLGTWKIEGKEIVIEFTSGKKIRAEIGEDSTLINIQNDAFNGMAVNSAELNTATEPELDETYWSMHYYGTINFEPNEMLTFRPDYGSYYPQVAKYIRKAKCLRVTLWRPMFFVIMPNGNTMKGRDSNGSYELSKR